MFIESPGSHLVQLSGNVGRDVLFCDQRLLRLGRRVHGQKRGLPRLRPVRRRQVHPDRRSLAGTNTGQGTLPEGINNAGVVVGNYYDSNGVNHGFIDHNGRFTTVDAPGAGTASGQGTTIFAINDEGVLVGYYVDASGLGHTFVDRSGIFFEFEAPGAATGPGQGSEAGGSATTA